MPTVQQPVSCALKLSCGAVGRGGVTSTSSNFHLFWLGPRVMYLDAREVRTRIFFREFCVFITYLPLSTYRCGISLPFLTVMDESRLIEELKSDSSRVLFLLSSASDPSVPGSSPGGDGGFQDGQQQQQQQVLELVPTSRSTFNHDLVRVGCCYTNLASSFGSEFGFGSIVVVLIRVFCIIFQVRLSYRSSLTFLL